MSKDNGGPAFPVRREGPNLTSWQEEGMTLRDYFAAKAAQSSALPLKSGRRWHD